MPGTVTSMPNSGCPVTIFGLSTLRCEWPMIVKLRGFFSVTDARSGGGKAAAFSASAP